MESSKKILCISTAYFMRMVVVIALVCQRHDGKTFHHAICEKLPTFSQQTPMFPTRWGNNNKKTECFSTLDHTIWTACSKCAFINVSPLLNLCGAFADSHIKTLSVDSWIMNSSKFSTNKKNSFFFHFNFWSELSPFCGHIKNGQTDPHAESCGFTLCTQLSDGKFYERYYEILIMNINNECNA